MVFGEYCHAANREWYWHGGAWSATVLRQVVDMNVNARTCGFSAHCCIVTQRLKSRNINILRLECTVSFLVCS